MNSADFFLLYLHLANQKAIKNYTFITKLQNQKLPDTKTCSRYIGADWGMARIEQGFAKETFALLAFAGLRKTIAVAEWRNLFGYRNFYDYQPASADHSSEFSLPYNITSGQKASKLKTLTRFKKTLNPIALSPNTSGAAGPCFSDKKSFSTALKITAKLQTAPSFSNKATLGELFFKILNSLGVAKKSLASKIKLQETAKTSNEKFLVLFNQRILSQSFKNNFILNLKNCDLLAFSYNPKQGLLGRWNGLASAGHSLSSSRGSSIQSKSIGAPFFDANSAQEPANENEQNFNSQVSQQGFLPLTCGATKPFFNILKVGRGSENPGLRHGLRQINLYKGKSREDHQIHLTSWAPILDLREFLPRSVATKEDQPLEKLSLTGFSQRAKFLPKLKTYGLQSYRGIGNLKKNPREYARISHIKDSLDSTKKEILLASPNLTKFYTASWLLESIRTELSSRNANIKRVLNQTFLLTQQPLFNFPKKQTEKFITPLKAKAEWAGAKSPIIREATVIPYLIKGLRISFSGRIGGKKGMAKTLTKTTGRVPLSTLREKIDFAKGVVQTKTGSLGVKVWVCYN